MIASFTRRLVKLAIIVHLRVLRSRRVILLQEGVAELVVRDLAVLARVEMAHDTDDLVLRHLERELLARLLHLLHRDDAVVVLVEPAEDLLHRRALLAHRLAELFHHRRQIVVHRAGTGDVGEVLARVFVHLEHLKLVVEALDDIAGQAVARLEKPASLLVEVLALLQELAGDDSEVALRRLVDRHAIVPQVEVEHKPAQHVLRLRLGKLRSEAEDLVIVVHELVEVLARRLGDQIQDRRHGVVPRTVARVLRRRRSRNLALRQAYIDLLLQPNTHLIREVLAREEVRVVDEELPVEEGDAATNVQILDLHEAGSIGNRVGWTRNLVVAPPHLAAAEKDREVVAAAIEGILLADFHGIISEEIHNGERTALVLRRKEVIHCREETADPAVVLHELLHVRIDVTTAKHHLTVQLFVIPLQRRVQRLARGDIGGEVIAWNRLRVRLIHRRVLLKVVRPCERVAVDQPDLLTVDNEILADDQIRRSDEDALRRRREAMTPDKRALREAGVIDAWLRDVHRVILKVIVDDGTTNTVVLHVRLRHGLLEKPVETKHVAIQSVPRWELVEIFGRWRLEDFARRRFRIRGSLLPRVRWLRRADELGLVVPRDALFPHHHRHPANIRKALGAPLVPDRPLVQLVPGKVRDGPEVDVDRHGHRQPCTSWLLSQLE